MRSRLEDLIATAERQLASRSYDAAIDTYRTAWNEDGAAAGVESRLDAAYQARDEARGIVRRVEVLMPPPMPAPVPDIEAAAHPDTAPPPPSPAPVIDARPIEPPSFSLIEADDYTLARAERREYPLEVERLSILHPTAPPPASETPEGVALARLAVACVIAVSVIVLAFLLK
ncbi:MAG: hypothetical protein WDO73_21580 [Ignavibacteriota bacterium]